MTQQPPSPGSAGDGSSLPADPSNPYLFAEVYEYVDQGRLDALIEEQEEEEEGWHPEDCSCSDCEAERHATAEEYAWLEHDYWRSVVA